jgi:hypothetical protein
MMTQATAVLLDADGVEMSEPEPTRYYDDGSGTLRLDSQRLTSLRATVAVWAEFRAPGLDPVRISVQAGGKYMEEGDTMEFSLEAY